MDLHLAAEIRCFLFCPSLVFTHLGFARKFITDKFFDANFRNNPLLRRARMCERRSGRMPKNGRAICTSIQRIFISNLYSQNLIQKLPNGMCEQVTTATDRHRERSEGG